MYFPGGLKNHHIVATITNQVDTFSLEYRNNIMNSVLESDNTSFDLLPLLQNRATNSNCLSLIKFLLPLINLQGSNIVRFDVKEVKNLDDILL